MKQTQSVKGRKPTPPWPFVSMDQNADGTYKARCGSCGGSWPSVPIGWIYAHSEVHHDAE